MAGAGPWGMERNGGLYGAVVPLVWCALMRCWASSARPRGPSDAGRHDGGALFATAGGEAGPAPAAELAAVASAVVAVRRTGSLHAAFVVGFPVYWLVGAL